MGYQDREYMRGGDGENANRRSNPLWWVLGLIALVLVFAVVRREAIGPGLPSQVQQMVDQGIPVRTVALELVPGDEYSGEVFPVLRTFFLSRGFDSHLHEVPDGSQKSAAFMLHEDDGLLHHHARYQLITDQHPTLKSRHTVAFQVFPVGSNRRTELLDDSRQLADALRAELEHALPGVVVQVDDRPQPVTHELDE